MTSATKALGPAPPPQPVYLQWRLIALVGAGGAVGTALRLGVSTTLPGGDTLIAVVVVNLTGAFALGWLLEAIALRGAETAVGRALRLGVGTGVLGGYTTYSALAVGSDGLIDTENLAAGLIVAVPTVVAGVALAALGATAARGIHKHFRHQR